MTNTLLKIFCTALMALLVACHGERNRMEEFSQQVYEPRYAEGFSIVRAPESKSSILISRNPWQGAEGVESMLFITRDGEQPPVGFSGQVLRGDARRVVCLSSSHIAMLDAIGCVESVVGVSGIDFISNEYIVANRDKVGDVGYDNAVDYEMLVALDADVVLLYGITGANAMETRLREMGIPYIYIGEYVEQAPLGKCEWMVAIAEIMGRRAEAEQLFEQIPQRYEALVELAAAAETPRPKVMLNTPYADTWFMASTSSYLARLIADAGGEYIYKQNDSSTSQPIDLEQAAMLTAEADVWLNVSGVATVRQLCERYPKFADVKCVRERAIYNSDRRATPAGGNDFWESGVVRPDEVLGDMIKIFHPELLSDREFVYYRQLE
jgi:iron complex transport system substrate-binding protein